MKRNRIFLAILIAAGMTFAQTKVVPPAVNVSPAERTMARANLLIQKNPKDFQAYNALALALSRRARETSDVVFYNQAEEALRRSFEISPDNIDGERIRVWLLLGKHEFATAREKAMKLKERMPRDVMVYAFLTDANIELGNYDEAEKAGQYMLDLKPGNLPGLTRAAYLRELFGDVEGSLELMNRALQSTPPSEVEDAAWILAQIGHLHLSVGRLAEAEQSLQQALAMFPGYHYGLANLAKVRTEQRRYDEAVRLLEQRYKAASHAENLYDLAEALQAAGRSADAQKAFSEFEVKSLAETNVGDNSNRELIFYYVDHAHEAGKALEVAEREYAHRHDVYTLDAYAWALHANGRYQEARKHIQAALAAGIRDAKLFHHAGEIGLALQDRPMAEKYLHQSAALRGPGSAQAQTVLAALGSGR